MTNTMANNGRAMGNNDGAMGDAMWVRYEIDANLDMQSCQFLHYLAHAARLTGMPARSYPYIGIGFIHWFDHW